MNPCLPTYDDSHKDMFPEEEKAQAYSRSQFENQSSSLKMFRINAL